MVSTWLFFEHWLRKSFINFGYLLCPILGRENPQFSTRWNRPNFPSDIARDGLRMEMMERGWRASRIPLACWATNSWWKGSKTPVLERVKAFYRKAPTSYRLICKWLTRNYSGYGWMDGWMDGRTDGWMDADGRTDGWMDGGWMDQWVDG